MNIEFCFDAGAVGFDGLDAQLMKTLGNLANAGSLAERSQDLQLAIAQQFDRRFESSAPKTL